MKFKIVTECLFDIKSGITFHPWKESSKIHFNHEHCRLIISKVTWAHFKPPCLWSVFRVLRLIFPRVFFQIKLIWIFISSFIMWLGTTLKSARYITFDIANVLKIITFPSIVRLRILHNLRIFECLSLLYKSFFHSCVWCQVKRF